MGVTILLFKKWLLNHTRGLLKEHFAFLRGSTGEFVGTPSSESTAHHAALPERPDSERRHSEEEPAAAAAGVGMRTSAMVSPAQLAKVGASPREHSSSPDAEEAPGTPLLEVASHTGRTMESNGHGSSPTRISAEYNTQPLHERASSWWAGRNSARGGEPATSRLRREDGPHYGATTTSAVAATAASYATTASGLPPTHPLTRPPSAHVIVTPRRGGDNGAYVAHAVAGPAGITSMSRPPAPAPAAELELADASSSSSAISGSRASPGALTVAVWNGTSHARNGLSPARNGSSSARPAEAVGTSTPTHDTDASGRSRRVEPPASDRQYRDNHDMDYHAMTTYQNGTPPSTGDAVPPHPHALTRLSGSVPRLIRGMSTDKLLLRSASVLRLLAMHPATEDDEDSDGEDEAALVDGEGGGDTAAAAAAASAVQPSPSHTKPHTAALGSETLRSAVSQVTRASAARFAGRIVSLQRSNSEGSNVLIGDLPPAVTLWKSADKPL